MLRAQKLNPLKIVPELQKITPEISRVYEYHDNNWFWESVLYPIKVRVIHLLIFLFSLQFAKTTQHSFQSVHKACLKTGSFKILQEHATVHFTGYLFGKP